jgi:hypothetical protein
MRSMEMAETAMKTDRYGSGGTSPSRQDARTETFVPRNSFSAVAELQNCSGNFVDSLRVFRPEASYRRRGIIRGQLGAPHTRVAWLGPRPRHLCVRAGSGPSPALFWSSESFWEK